MALGGIEIVVPSLTALLAGTEVLFIRLDEKVLRYFVPAVFRFLFSE